MSQEVLTFQFGNYSNFVGTHYWNLQRKNLLKLCNNESEYFPDKMYRECLIDGKLTHVPRLMFFENKSNLKALKEDGSFNDEDTPPTSAPQTDIYEQPRIKRSQFSEQGDAMDWIAMEKQMTAWSDFLATPFHENSCQLLNQFYNDGRDFHFYGVGQQEFDKLSEDIDDKLHFWVEECNSIEGFQIFTDMHDGFCGLSGKFVQELHEEYGKKCCLSYINWPVLGDKDENIYQDLNVALTFQSFQEHCSLYVLQSMQKDLFKKGTTRSLNNLSYEAKWPYHSSAILATAIESTSLPWRKQNRPVSMSELCHHVSQNKWKLAGSSLNFSYFSNGEGASLFDQMMTVSNLYGPLLTSLFPGVSNVTDIKPSCHYVVLQNISEHAVIPNRIEPRVLQSLQLNKNIFTNNPLNVLEFFTERFHPVERTMSKLFYCNDSLDTSIPFPTIFANASKEQDLTVSSSLHTSQSFYTMLHDLVKRIRNINLHKHNALTELGLDQDSMNELREDLLNLARVYDAEKTFDELET